eukprot:1377669-Amphidinium_carterae.1
MMSHTMCWRREPPSFELFSSLHAFTQQHFCLVPKGLQANKKTLALQFANFCFNQWSAHSPRGHSIPIVNMRALCHAGAGDDVLPRFDASVSRFCFGFCASPALSDDASDRRDFSSQALPLTQIDEEVGREVVLESPVKRARRVTPIKMNKLRATKDQQLDCSGSLVTVLPLPAAKPPTRKLRPRWNVKRISDDAILNLREYLLSVNQANDQWTKHDVGIVYDGEIDIACCAYTQEVDPELKLNREVEGAALFCARCGVVCPLSERSAFAKRLCSKRPQLSLQDMIDKSQQVRSALADFRRTQLPLSTRAQDELSTFVRQAVQALEASGVTVLFQLQDDVSRPVHDGAGVTFSSLNVGCLSSKLQGLVDIQSDFVALQEVGIPRDGVPSLERFAKSLSYRLSFGACPQAFDDTLGRRNLNRSLGVAMLGTNSVGVARIDSDFPLCRQLQTRLSTWLLVKGDWQCNVHVVYFKTGGSQEDERLNELLMATLLRRTELKAGKPQMIA